MYDRILIRYGDLMLKGKNQHEFVSRVYQLIVEKLKGLQVKIEKSYDRTYIDLENEDPEKVIERLNRVTGIMSYSLAVKCESTIEAISEKANQLMQEEVKDFSVRFKVESKRVDKQFPLTSQQITKEVARYVLRHNPLLRVDVHHPQKVLSVELRKEASYIYTEEIKGLGGFPVGVAGKGLLMMSGGIDSAVAGFLAMKQGVNIEIMHYESTPLTSIESAQKVIDLSKKLAYFAPSSKIKVHLVPFMELHQELLAKVSDSYTVTIMRRMMYRIAAAYAMTHKIPVIINGESIGQVASQTLDSMHVVNAVTSLPVLRPLATYDKQDIVNMAKKIDTYEIAIRPFEDCCTIYMPKSPVIRPSIERAEKLERKIAYEPFIQSCIDNIKTLEITPTSELDLSVLGFTVTEALS